MIHKPILNIVIKIFITINQKLNLQNNFLYSWDLSIKSIYPRKISSYIFPLFLDVNIILNKRYEITLLEAILFLRKIFRWYLNLYILKNFIYIYKIKLYIIYF